MTMFGYEDNQNGMCHLFAEAYSIGITPCGVERGALDPLTPSGPGTGRAGVWGVRGTSS